MLIGGWWPRLRTACDPPLPFVLSPSLVGMPLVGTRPPPTPTLRGEPVPCRGTPCGYPSPAHATRSRRACRRGSRLALSFVVSRARVFGGPCRTTLRIQQPTPPPSRRPRPGPSSNHPLRRPPAIPPDQPSLLRRPLLSEPLTTSAHGDPVKASREKANPRPMSTRQVGRMTRRLLLNRLALRQVR